MRLWAAIREWVTQESHQGASKREVHPKTGARVVSFGAHWNVCHQRSSHRRGRSRRIATLRPVLTASVNLSPPTRSSRRFTAIM